MDVTGIEQINQINMPTYYYEGLNYSTSLFVKKRFLSPIHLHSGTVVEVSCK